jgi:hypothetical protein
VWPLGWQHEHCFSLALKLGLLRNSQQLDILCSQ